MPIELTCTGCAQTLRVGDDHAGKKARCPKCGTISTVPISGEAPALAPTDTSSFDEPTAGSANPFADLPEPAPTPYRSPGHGGVAPSRFQKPDRGGLVLAFGILGIVTCCVPFGIAAWVMGSADLKEIRAGRMNPAGQGLTQAGMILGIISTILAILWGLFYAFLIAASSF